MTTEFDVWLGRLRTEATRNQYRSYCNKFFACVHATPAQTLKWGVQRAEDEMLVFKDEMISAGYAGKTVRLAWSAVKRWFHDHRTRVAVPLRDVRLDKTWLSYIPTREDVRLLLDECDLMYRVLVALLAFSGFRQSDAVSLQYKHIKASLEAKDEVVTIIKQQQKTGLWYFTFLAPQGVAYVREFLLMRQRNGETVTDETYIVSRTGRRSRPDSVKKQLRRLIWRTVGQHPTGEDFRKFTGHALRKYFRRIVGSVGESTAEFLMGHREGIESMTATYAGLRDLDREAIAGLKAQYVRLLPQLETEMTDLSVKARIQQLEEREAEFRKLQEEQAAMQEEMKRISEVLDKYGKKE